MGDNNNWSYLPTTVVLKIFGYLKYTEILRAARVCKRWNEISKDELLWKNLFYTHFTVDRTIKSQGRFWYDEFKRLCYHIPLLLTETLTDHSNQVLHVSFSHDGKYFATCSKDGYILVWNSTYPASIKYVKDMKSFSWKYTQFSQFNESDTLLLVSGVHFGSPYSTSGEIAVFRLEDELQLQCRVVNKPYDIFGTWYSDYHLVSGDLHWLAHLVSTSILWLNKASQETLSEHIPVTQNLYKFYNRNASSIRAIMVANCLPNSENVKESSQPKDINVKEEGDVQEHGNPVSHCDINLPTASNQEQVQIEPRSSQMWRRQTDYFEYATPIRYSAEYREVESRNIEDYVYDSDSGDSDIEVDYPHSIHTEEEEEKEDEKDNNITDDIETNSDADQVVLNDKYLIFTTGFKTYTPHQIGFKRIKPYMFPRRLDPGPSLKERIVLRDKKKELLRSNSPPPEPNWTDFDAVADKFDKIDHLIDLHGHIIGMGLSPDHRYLYVNSRPWPQGYVIRNPLDPPPIAQEIDIHVIDLVTLKQVGTMLRSHKAYTPNNECFFIFLDVCDEYVASGAEDKHGYLWDRHYGCCLAKFPHTDVVNSVAFNPKDPEMLVTTSDDFTIKVWRSRAKVSQLGLSSTRLERGVEVRKGLPKRIFRRKC